MTTLVLVVSSGAVASLTPAELEAVLTHERAHARARHDLVLEAFTVLQEAFPAVVTSRHALDEVRLLLDERSHRLQAAHLVVVAAAVVVLPTMLVVLPWLTDLRNT